MPCYEKVMILYPKTLLTRSGNCECLATATPFLLGSYPENNPTKDFFVFLTLEGRVES